MSRKAISHSKKVLTVLRGLQGKTTISKYCAAKGIARSSFYRWRAEVLSTIATSMENKNKSSRRGKKSKH